MSNKRSIHEIIEEQEPESKQRMWEEVRRRIDEEEMIGTDKPHHKKFPWKKFGTIAASFVLVLGISLFSVFHFMPQEELKSRYCTQDDYTIQPVEETIQQHSISLKINWLYLDWYDQAENVVDVAYYLNDTGEKICYSEEIINGETGDFIKLYITDNRTDIDVLQRIKEACIKANTIDGHQIIYNSLLMNAYAFFEFKNYRYYIEMIEPMSETAILDIVEELLP